MTYNITVQLNTYGIRKKINLRIVSILLIALCLVTPLGTNLFIPCIVRKCKGVVYV